MARGQKFTGFTLLEALVVVALLAIITAIGIPTYNGYVRSSKESVAQNSLLSIYLMEQDHYAENGKFYTTPSGDYANEINNVLFSRIQTLNVLGDYHYHIEAAGAGYRAWAKPVQPQSLTQYCRDDNNVPC